MGPRPVFAVLDDHSRLAVGYLFGNACGWLQRSTLLAARGARSEYRSIRPTRNSVFPKCVPAQITPARDRSRGLSAPCVTSSCWRAGTHRQRGPHHRRRRSRPPRCWSSTGCSRRGWRPNPHRAIWSRDRGGLHLLKDMTVFHASYRRLTRVRVQSAFTVAALWRCLAARLCIPFTKTVRRSGSHRKSH